MGVDGRRVGQQQARRERDRAAGRGGERDVGVPGEGVTDLGERGGWDGQPEHRLGPQADGAWIEVDLEPDDAGLPECPQTAASRRLGDARPGGEVADRGAAVDPQLRQEATVDGAHLRAAPACPLRTA
ncbi:hypothetical protein EF879_01885 [Micromonospora sp. HM5-17]|nr:hypothetical protein EF879_01885 [Micromonospora sp. HM5-17]